LEIDENVLQLNKYHPSLATAYNNIGEIYHKLGNYENALKTLEHALVICLKGTVSTHTDLAAIYNNLGCVYDKTKCPEKALEMFEKALEIDTKVLPENHSSLAVSHNNIAALYREKDELTKALYHQEKSLRILLKSDVKDNAAQLSLCQHNLGCIHLSLGNHTKALNMLEKALKTQMEYLPEYHENFSNTYLSLSRAYEKQENIPQALEYLEKAVENARRSLLPHNQSKFLVFQEHLDLFKLVHFSEDKPNQKTIYMQAELLDNTNVQAQFATSSNNVSERIRSLSNCGTMHSRKTEYDMAMKCFDDAITLYNQRQFLALTDEQELEELMTLLYFNLARLYYRQQNRTAAFQFLEKSLDLASKQDQQRPMLAEVYNFAGIMYSYKGDFSRAEHYFNLAIDVAKKNLPSDHPDLQRYYLQLKQLKYMMQHV
jgi:tetratricopeptide (TPR) repeat protein